MGKRKDAMELERWLAGRSRGRAPVAKRSSRGDEPKEVGEEGKHDREDCRSILELS